MGNVKLIDSKYQLTYWDRTSAIVSISIFPKAFQDFVTENWNHYKERSL